MKELQEVIPIYLPTIMHCTVKLKSRLTKKYVFFTEQKLVYILLIY